MQEATRKVILRLKEVKAQKGLTYQDIVDACEAQNEAVSLSTVKRIFAKGSEDGPDYRTYTISAIFHAVVGTEDTKITPAQEAELTDTAKEAITENAALKAVVEMNYATMEELNKQIEALKAEKEALLKELETMQTRLDTTIEMFKISIGVHLFTTIIEHLFCFCNATKEKISENLRKE